MFRREPRRGRGRRERREESEARASSDYGCTNPASELRDRVLCIEAMRKEGKKKKPVSFLSILGPGLIAGAADDDPSGIATYSIAGAQLGTTMLWTAVITWPLMASVQMMCARIGMVSGAGLARALRRKFPRWMVLIAGLALLFANTFNIGAHPA